MTDLEDSTQQASVEMLAHVAIAYCSEALSGERTAEDLGKELKRARRLLQDLIVVNDDQDWLAEDIEDLDQLIKAAESRLP